MLLLAVMVVASRSIVPPESQPPNSAQFIIAGAAILAALAGFGIWTSVGLLRLRAWARTSILVFACFLAASCSFGLMVTMAMPIPAQFTAGTARAFHGAMAAVYGIPLAIAAWWLIQFNTRSTKTAITSPIPEAASPRPLSITVIAWASLFGGASCLIGMLGRLPAFFFGVLFTGWTAAAIYVLLGALSLYIGKGLLDLQERARLVAIGWYAFSLVHMGLVTLVPTLRQRTFELQRTFAQNQKTPIVFDQGVFTSVILAFSAIVAAAVIWFLIRNRTAFVRAENP
jgi:hypothetical protein